MEKWSIFTLEQCNYLCKNSQAYKIKGNNFDTITCVSTRVKNLGNRCINKLNLICLLVVHNLDSVEYTKTLASVPFL